MARVKLRLPNKFDFSTEITVRVSDVNYGGHLSNDRVLSIIHEARTRHLRAFGFTELDVDGVGTIMTDAVIVYKSQAFHGDILIVSVTLRDFAKFGCDYIYQLSEKTSGREVARAKTGLVFYNYATQRMARIPPRFKQMFAPNEIT